VSSIRPVTIDEAHRAPELLHAVLQALEGERRPSRYLLTSSTDPSRPGTGLGALADAAAHLVLRPLTAREKRGDVEPPPWPELLAAAGASEVLQRKRVARAIDWRALALEGGLPRAVLAPDEAARAEWFESHVDACIQSDLRDLASVGDLTGFGRLLRLAAARAGGLVNAAELARDAGLSRTTAQRWLSLLVATYLLTPLDPFLESRGRRLIRTPKLYLVDAGLGLHLAGIADAGALSRLPQPAVWLEHLILNELLAWRETVRPKPGVYYRRTASGEEVDFVIDSGQRLLPVNLCSTVAPRPRDVRSLESFSAELGDRSPFGVLLREGGEAEQIAPRTVALPLGMVL
jgi:hypothetical protein